MRGEIKQKHAQSVGELPSDAKLRKTFRINHWLQLAKDR